MKLPPGPAPIGLPPEMPFIDTSARAPPFFVGSIVIKSIMGVELSISCDQKPYW